MIIPPQQPGQPGTPNPQQLQQAAASAGLVLPDEAVLAFQQGRMLEAIKLIRAANPGLDLARAKAVVERMQSQARVSHAGSDAADLLAAGKAAVRQHARRPPTVAMGDPPGQLRWLLIVLALVAVAAWLGWRSFG